jgi:hypothetical protein
MPWNVIIPSLIIVALAVAIFVIKRKQDAPLRSFGEALDFTRQALKEKPDAISYTSFEQTAKEVVIDPSKQVQTYGNYKLEFEDVTLRYKYEKTAEFIEMNADGLTHVGLQYIADNPTEIYLDGVRVAEPRKFLEDYDGDLMTVRRLLRKHLRLKKTESAED